MEDKRGRSGCNKTTVFLSCCDKPALKQEIREFVNILFTLRGIISKHFLWLCLYRYSKLICQLLWSIAVIRTAYCPYRWIGAVRRRKGQCWAERQRYSQNALFPTRAHCSINTPSEYWRQTLIKSYLCATLNEQSQNQAFLSITD